MIRYFANKKYEFLTHLSIWVGYSFLVFSGPIMSQDFTTDSLYITTRALIINSILFYINTFVLLPKLVGKSKYLLYIVTIVTLLVGSSMVYEVTGHWMKPPKGERSMQMVNDFEKPSDFPDQMPPDMLGPRKPPHIMFGFKGPNLLFGFMSSIGILFISTIFWVISESKRRQELEMSLINANLTTEMKFLKSQINPHFLFNALNNIYSLSHLNSSKTPDMILKLSDMLRFMLYESEDKKVAIGKELDYIDHFIDFQKLKIEGEPRIEMDVSNAERHVLIEPMLLLPFIENAFKHSKIEDTTNGWIKIWLYATSKNIQFSISNSLPTSTLKVDKVGGIGLENVKKRLLILYPDKHKLEIFKDNDEFRVELSIDLENS